jgi:WD40 repeat protein
MRSMLLSAVVLPLAAFAAPLPVANLEHKDPVDYSAEIVPLLKANCTACHNKTTTKGGLNMETPALMLKGGENGPAIELGKGADSLLFQAAAHLADSDMPPKSNKVGAVNFKPEELALIKLWIDQGAKAGEKKVQQIAWQPLPPGLHPIYAVAMSPGGELAACSRANQIFIYDVAAKKLLTQFVAHRDMALALAFSPDGSYLASGSYGEVKLWKADGALPPESPVARLTRLGGLAAMDAAFFTAEAAAADKEIATIKDRIKKANDAIADTKKKLEEKRTALKSAGAAKSAAQKIADDASAALAKAPAALSKANADAQTKLDEAIRAEMSASAALKTANAARVAAQKIADEAHAALAKAADPALTQAEADGKAKLNDAIKAETGAAAALKAATGLKVAAQKAADDAHSALTKGPDPKLTKAEADAKAKLQAALKAEMDATASVNAAETADKDAQAEPTKLNALLSTTSKLAESAKASQSSAQASQKKYAEELAAASKAPPPAAATPLPVQWTLARTIGTGDDASPITDRVNALAFSPDGKTLAVGSGAPSRDGDITFWDTGSGTLKQTLEGRHSDTVLCLDWSPDGKLIASGGADKQLRVSDVASGKLLKTFEGHTHHVMGVSWRADGRVLATSGADNVVKVWDWIKGERRKNLDGWDKEVTSVRYLGTTTRLIATSGDKQVRALGEDASSPAALPGTTDFMYCGAVSRDGSLTVAGGEDSVLRVWNTKGSASVAVFPKPEGTP